MRKDFTSFDSHQYFAHRPARNALPAREFKSRMSIPSQARGRQISRDSPWDFKSRRLQLLLSFHIAINKGRASGQYSVFSYMAPLPLRFTQFRLADSGSMLPRHDDASRHAEMTIAIMRAYHSHRAYYFSFE